MIGHKDGACIIGDPNFLPPRLIRNMNQFNVLRGYEPTDNTIECNSQSPKVHFKSHTPPLKPVLWFCISWGDLIIVPLIMVMLGFTLHFIHHNIPLTLL